MATEYLIGKHREWKARDINWDAIHKLELEKQTVPCVRCGCFGNMECGHELLDKNNGCMLCSNMICPCCIEIVKATRIENKIALAGQEDLFR